MTRFAAATWVLTTVSIMGCAGASKASFSPSQDSGLALADAEIGGSRAPTPGQDSAAESDAAPSVQDGTMPLQSDASAVAVPGDTAPTSDASAGPSDGPTAKLAMVPSALRWEPGRPREVRLINVANVGGAATGTVDVTVEGMDPRDFRIVSVSCLAPMAIGGTCQVGVTFAPLMPTTREETAALVAREPSSVARCSLWGR